MNVLCKKIRKWWKDNGIKGVQLNIVKDAVIFSVGKHCFGFSTINSVDFFEGYLRDKRFGGRWIKSDVQEWISKKVPLDLLAEAAV